MIINLLDNAQSNSVSVVLNTLNIISIDDFFHTITINQSKVVNSNPIINSKITIINNPLPVLLLKS